VLKKMNPEVAVLVSSGIASNLGLENRRAELMNLGVTTILRKPFSVEQILGTVNDLLN